MPAPLVSAAAISVARSRAGRRTLFLAGASLLVALAVAVTPVVLVAAAVTSQARPPASAPDARPGSGPAVSGEWALPLAGPFTKGRGFGHNPVIGCSYCSVNHQGYDMAQGCGSTIYAAGPGTVITAGSYQGYGNSVRIDHGDRVVTLYGHMEWDSLRVFVGDTVAAGTPIGAEGNTGRSFGCHLHYEIIAHGTSIDPAPFMSSLGLPLP